jgi:predicted amidohydrolase
LSLVQPVSTSPYVLGLQRLAKTNRLSINAGIHEPSLLSSKKIRNTSIWIDETGEIVQRYQKLHLFDMEIEGGPVARESE